MAITVREALPNDFEFIYQFLCDLQRKDFDRNLMESLYLENIKSDNLYLVACEGSDVKGYLSCHFQTLLHHAGKVAEIQEVYVKQSFRNTGIGKLLVDEAKKLAKGKGAMQLEVTTRQIREKAIQFYIRESFEDSHKKLVYYF